MLVQTVDGESVRKKEILISVRVLSFVGITLSLISMYLSKDQDVQESFQALCTTNPFQCAAVIHEQYGTPILGMPDFIVSLVFYALVGVYTFQRIPYQENVFLVLSLASCLYSMNMVYQLYNLKILCFVCISKYLLNVFILFKALEEHSNRKIFKTQ